MLASKLWITSLAGPAIDRAPRAHEGKTTRPPARVVHEIDVPAPAPSPEDSSRALSARRADAARQAEQARETAYARALMQPRGW